MSFLRKVRFTTIGGLPVTDPTVYGYVETLTSAPCRNPQSGMIEQEKLLAIYDIDGHRLDIGGMLVNTHWQDLPYAAYIWNGSDFWTAIEAFRFSTEETERTE